MAKFEVGDYVTQDWMIDHFGVNETNILKIDEIKDIDEDNDSRNYYTKFWLTSVNNEPWFIEFYTTKGASFAEYEEFLFRKATQDEIEIYKKFENMSHEDKLKYER